MSDQDQSQQSDTERAQLEKAANVLQAGYRGHRSKREAAGLNLEISDATRNKGKQRQTDADQQGEESQNSPITPRTRWNEAIQSGGLSAANKDQNASKNDPVSRWKRSGLYAERITGTDGRQKPGNETGDETGGDGTMAEKTRALAPNKQMEAQYWLEMVDSKHRYGTNLKPYHDAWNKSDTKSNFFHWLDHGEGKDLDLQACPRSQLDKERVTYLSAEQRKNYLVDIGSDGLLYWHRNKRKVDTAKGKWEDLGDGRGIGYKGERDNLPPPTSPEDDSSSDSSGTSSLYSSSDSDGEIQPPSKSKHYHQMKGDNESRHSYWTSPRALMDVLLRKTINSNTWIYVCTTKGQLYVGIKATGGFQHSSFMYGATVSSAGLLKAKQGQLTSLSPLSGHYRAGTAQFKGFLKTLKEKGADMSSVSISKSLIVIGGIEKYAEVSKKKKKLGERMRQKLHLGPSDKEKSEEEDKKRNEKIEAEARRKEQTEPSQGENQNDSGEDAIEGNLHEGVANKDLTDQERAEKAVALIRSAFAKGLKGEKKKVEEAGGPKEDQTPTDQDSQT